MRIFSSLFSAAALCAAVDAQTVDRIWVDPNNGCDASPALALNNARKPMFTLQAAIDHLEAFSVADHRVVIAMPGIYQAPQGSPVIVMKSGVNVQGVGARRCIIRGNGAPNSFAFWPDMMETGHSLTEREALVSYEVANPTGSPDDYPERLDGFTLQGGDIQVWAESEVRISGIISNCVFDMRTGFPAPNLGPSFGIEMVHVYNQGSFPDGDLANGRYWSYRFSILNNTFILGMEGTGSGEVDSESRFDAVAIIDVNDPLGDPNNPGQCMNPDLCDTVQLLRRMGKANVQNNLIRSLPGQVFTKDLLGIDASDTTVAIGNPSPLAAMPGASNAFRANRSTNNGFDVFFSQSGAPAFALDLAGVVDPAFVGEALAVAPFAVPNYVDWRLLPGSPLANLGAAPVSFSSSGSLSSQSGTNYPAPPLPELSAFDWDMEGYGNPRIHGGLPDIGADETHSYIMAGSYANEDTSHNTPPGFLYPDAGAGQPERFLIFPAQIGSTPTNNLAVAIRGTNQIPQLNAVPFPPQGTPDCPNGGALLHGWYNQPGTFLPPRFNPALPSDYMNAYVSLTSAPAPLPWNGFMRTLTVNNPLLGSSQPSTFALFAFNLTDTLPTSIVDIESSATFFNTQAVLTMPGGAYRSNLQSEVR